MKFQCPTAILSENISLAQKAVSIKSPFPVLTGILFTADETTNTITLASTDLQMSIETSFPAEVIESGSAVLSSKFLGDIIKKLPETNLMLEYLPAEGKCVIRYGSSELAVATYRPDEFPKNEEIIDGESFYISGEEFSTYIKQVLFATGTDESRPVFTGVLFEIVGQELRLVASDTHRLAFRKAFIKREDPGKNINVIIPSRTLHEAVRIFGMNEEILIRISEGQVEFRGNGVKLTSRLIEGQFPNYQQVIPTTFKSNLLINKKYFLDSLERAVLLPRDKDKTPVAKFYLEKERMIMTSQSESGSIREEIPISLDGEEFTVAFNTRYLIDVLRVLENEEIYLSLTGPLNPGVVKPVGDENYLCLVLPVRPS
ncbi:DNA polymerase III subunit beta [Carboxydothermus pertinax]|uniref:Beta sliding clamp n=1 Tax=Carboxydothermus pertinax TaxID=870242 RepID=A0A1L8CT64_9THEO|nr:DNA polymerase III subunit beta [Carboxydothermus pertinax]GAV22097.1 DNA polymerase III subunit beta [Carboxydothermus pertinax]